MAFETVEKGSFGGGQGTVEPLVSIRKSETVGINRPAMQMLDDDVEYVEVKKDDENEYLVAIIPSEESEHNSYKLSINEGSATVGCSVVLKKLDLIVDQTKRFKPESTDIETVKAATIENALVFDKS